MKKALLKFVLTLLLFVAFGVLQKVLFVSVYHNLLPDGGFLHLPAVIWHGLPMDLSIAGYLTFIPALLIIAEIFSNGKWLQITRRTYILLVSFVLACITIVDLALYGTWGFRLDMTPVFYFTTSPSAAVASAEWWQIIVATAGVAAIVWMLYASFRKIVEPIKVTGARPRWLVTSVMVILTAALFIPVRGGVTVSTMNPSRSYFSSNQRLNHAAINPAFSLMYSATHQGNFREEFRFMSDAEADAAVAALDADNTVPTDTTANLADSTTYHNISGSLPLLNCNKPDIYLIILESFSAHLMPVLGGESIALKLDSIAREGVLFTNFYASSFRTDRALPAILGGFPAQPTTSIMKYVDKVEQLPTISGELKKAGYTPSYYYGGDINFTNMNAYLVNAGFETIVSDKDFPLSERLSKWGAHDHVVFNRALADALDVPAGAAPQLKVIQTSSSHEPFEVPFSSKRFAGEPRKNAFAYTDSCLAAFIDELHASPRYDCSLIVIVPDHLGAYPLNLPDAAARHHVPLVLAGGALSRHGIQIDVPASQTDMAATLLELLGLDASMFSFSHDILDESAPHYAVFTEAPLIGIVTENDTIVYNHEADAIEKAASNNHPQLEKQAKAYLQVLYNKIADL